MPFRHEEHRELSSFRSWAIVCLLCLVIIVWGLFNYATIGDPPRHGDLGVLPDVPGQSIYSTAGPVPGAPIPKQLAPLPEAIPISSNVPLSGREEKPVNPGTRP